jgi:hypothetical protein
MNEGYRAAPVSSDAPLAQPEPEGPSDDELDYWWAEIDGGPDCCAWRPYARTVLARFARPAIKPVPVSERLPGPEDCDADGRCWWWCHRHESWEFHSSQDHYMHWLPHWALPVPTPNES